jgi:hypothetical protein
MKAAPVGIPGAAGVLSAIFCTMPTGKLCRVEDPNRRGLDVFTRHSLHALSHLQVVEGTKQNECIL